LPSDSTANEGGPPSWLPPYVLLQPLVQDRDLLVLDPHDTGVGADLLRRAGARLLPAVELPQPSIPAGAADIALCIGVLDGQSPSEREQTLVELRRLLREDGFALLMVDGAMIDYWRLGELLRPRFEHVVLLGQRPMAGAYLTVLDPPVEAEELAFADDLVPEPDPPSHFVALVSGVRLPALHTYLLVTLSYEACHAELAQSQRRLVVEGQRLQQDLGRLGARIGEREGELLRLAGRTARLERLEAELAAARRECADLEQLRQTHLELRREHLALQQQAGRDRADAAGLRQELDRAYDEIDDLVRRAEDAERAAHELALGRDELVSQHASLVQGHRELTVEFERLRGQFLEAQQELTARRREAMTFTVSLDRATAEVHRLGQETSTQRSELEQAWAEVRRVEDHSNAMQQQLAARDAELEGATAELATVEAEQRLATRERDDLQQSLATREQVLQTREAELESTHGELEQLRGELQLVQVEREEQQQLLQDAERESRALLAERDAALAEQEQRLAALSRSLEQTEHERTEREQDLLLREMEIEVRVTEHAEALRRIDGAEAALAPVQAALARAEERVQAADRRSAEDAQQAQLAQRTAMELDRERGTVDRLKQEAEMLRAARGEAEQKLQQVTRQLEQEIHLNLQLRQRLAVSTTMPKATTPKATTPRPTVSPATPGPTVPPATPRSTVPPATPRPAASPRESDEPLHCRTTREVGSLGQGAAGGERPDEITLPGTGDPEPTPDEEWIHDTVTREAPPNEALTRNALARLAGLRPVAALTTDELAPDGDTSEGTQVERDDDLAQVQRMVQALAEEEE